MMPQSPGAPPSPANPSGPAPLSFAQERLWFLDRLEPGRPTYNLTTFFLRMAGALDLAALCRALDELARRHESLRTTFPEIDGRPVQAVAPASPFPLPLVDLRGLADEEVREAESRALARAEAARPYDLARGPLTRGLLFRLKEGEHMLLMVQHHIVSDGWSSGVLLRELGALYEAFAEGRPSPLPEPPLQPAAFARRQREALQGASLEALLGWWRERLEGSPPVLELPLDHPRPAVQRFRGGYVPFALSRPVASALRGLGQRQGITGFMSLLAAFLMLLHRSTGRTDLLVGFPSAGREELAMEGTVGFFVNTLPLRLSVADDPSFVELGRRVRDGVLQAVAHQDLPFDRLVEELRPERSLSYSPLIQVLFLFQPGGTAGDLDLPGLRLTPEGIGGTGTAKFDLTLIVADGPEGMRCTFEYDRDLFDPPTVRRLALHFQRLLAAALVQPRVRLSDLQMLSEPERHHLLTEWNDTRRRDPGDLVHRLFLERAREAPEAPALTFEGKTLTYGELAAWSVEIARRLRALGAGPESRIGVCLERSPELIASLLGVLMAGAAYVPLDPAQPRERRLGLLRECGAGVVVTGEGLAGELEGPKGQQGHQGHQGLEILLVPGVPDVSDVPCFPDPFPDNLAYILFTSGSTGRPKGVAVPHRAVVRLVRDADYASLEPGEVFLQLSPASFDASTFEIWGCLCNGGRLVIFPPGLPSLEGLGEVVRAEGVTTLWLTAGLFHSMVEERLESLAGLRQLLAGGDVLSPAHVRRALAALPGTRLIDGYGPTECATFVSTHRMTDPSRIGNGVPIGRPIANDRLYVLDAALRPLPVGAGGDLYAGGAGVSLGYLERPELTAERFVPDPFGRPGDRLYRTGDRARWTAEGVLEFQGRADAQLKIRGFRIEPAEVEAALLAVPGVLRAAVVGAGPAGNRSLAAFWVGEARVDELRSELRRRLPEPMVPTVWVPMADLPLTRNGKVDRRALAALALEGGAGRRSAERVPPRNPLEESLVAAAAEVLGRDPGEVGVFDNFFDLGGHSLLATRFVSMLHSRWGIEAPIQLVFDTPHLAALADRIMEAELADADDDLLASVLAEMGEEGVP